MAGSWAVGRAGTDAWSLVASQGRREGAVMTTALAGGGGGRGVHTAGILTILSQWW